MTEGVGKLMRSKLIHNDSSSFALPPISNSELSIDDATALDASVLTRAASVSCNLYNECDMSRKAKEA